MWWFVGLVPADQEKHQYTDDSDQNTANENQFGRHKDLCSHSITTSFRLLPSCTENVCVGTVSEHSAMPVFDAAAFAMTYFYFRNRKRMSDIRKSFASAAR